MEDEGKLHLAGAEEFTHGFHAAEEVLVDDVDGGFFGHGGIKVGFDAGFFPINNALRQAFEQWEGGEGFSTGVFRFGGGDAFEKVHECLEGIIAIAAAIVDHVEGDFALAVLNTVHGHEF